MIKTFRGRAFLGGASKWYFNYYPPVNQQSIEPLESTLDLIEAFPNYRTYPLSPIHDYKTIVVKIN